MMVLAFFVARHGHSESSRKRSRSVARAKHVILRFISTQEAANAAILFYSRQELAPAGQIFTTHNYLTIQRELVGSVPFDLAGLSPSRCKVLCFTVQSQSPHLSQTYSVLSASKDREPQ